MKRLAVIASLALVGCKSRHEEAPPSPPPADARPPADAPLDAWFCPGTPTQCTECVAGVAASCTAIVYGLPDHETIEWFDRGCAGGDPAGCEGVAWYYQLVVRDHDRMEAANARRAELLAKVLERNRARCEARDEDGCFQAGLALEFGNGTPKDLAAARELYVASCDRGGAGSCIGVANMEGTTAADKVRYSKAACAAGDPRECGGLVGVFGDPPIAPAALAFAAAQLDRLCRAKDGIACWVLGGVYWKRDRARARAALTAGCAITASLCEDVQRFARGEKFLKDLPPMPTLDLQPLIKAARSGRQ